MLISKKKKTDPSAWKDHSFICSQTQIVGDIVFNGGLHVEGRVQGNIRAEDGCLNLHGEVVGDIEVPNAIINGVVRGNLTCLQHLELAAGARVHGVVVYQNMEMMLGAQVSGQMKPVAQEQGQVVPMPQRS